MTVLENEDAHGADETHEGEHHNSPIAKYRREHLALWLLIGGDAIFWLLELFSWFYLKALNTNGMWRGAACTTANPCTDGLGNPITAEIAKANPWFTVVVAILSVVAALLFVRAEAAGRDHGGRGSISAPALGAMLVLLGGIAVLLAQFNDLPFSTIDGAYASCFEFFMGSTLVHFLILGFIALGVTNRARRGRYDGEEWRQLRLVRIFAGWIAVSTVVLSAVMILAA